MAASAAIAAGDAPVAPETGAVTGPVRVGTSQANTAPDERGTAGTETASKREGASGAEPARVLLVDEQQLFRRGVRHILGSQPGVEVVGELGNTEDVVDRVLAERPDVVVMGELSGGWDVFAATLRRRLPDTGLVVLLDRISEEDLFYALRAGACACRPRTIAAAELISAVRRAARGECTIHMSDVNSKEPSRRILAQEGMGSDAQSAQAAVACPLSEREMEILAGVAEGCSNKEIGRRCGISDQTVKNHLTAVLRKLGVTDRTEAVVIALRHRWLKIESIKIGRAAA